MGKRVRIKGTEFEYEVVNTYDKFSEVTLVRGIDATEWEFPNDILEAVDTPFDQTFVSDTYRHHSLTVAPRGPVVWIGTATVPGPPGRGPYFPRHQARDIANAILEAAGGDD